MGQILSNPVIDKEHHSGFDDLTAFGLCAMQGWRMSMEDAHIVEPQVLGSESDEHLAMYVIFDGHGGSSVAKYCSDNLLNFFKDQFQKMSSGTTPANYRNLIINTFIHIDDQIGKNQVLKNEQSGSTATLLLLSKLQNKLICANSGDSRTVLSSNATAKALSFDHKPNLTTEFGRIIAANGFVEMNRVNGNLALSRAFGDFNYKGNPDLPAEEQIVTVVPDVIEHLIDYTNDEFVILACDGIWDCISSQECVDLVHYGINCGDMSLNNIASRIIDVCCAPTVEGSGIGCDNISITIVALLKDGESEDRWFERIRSKSVNATTSFAKQRKIIYGSYLPKDPTLIFDITTKKTQADKNRKNDTGYRSIGKCVDNSRKEMQDESSTDSMPGDQQQGSIDLFPIEALLEAGLQAHERYSHFQNQDSSKDNSGVFQTSALAGMLNSLSGAAAGEVAPFLSEEEEESEKETQQAKDA